MQGKVAKVSESMTWEIPEPEPNHRYFGLMFEKELTPTVSMAAGFVIVPAKQEQRTSRHEGVEELYFVYQGKGKFVLDGEEFDVEPGTAVYIAPGCRHRAINTGDEEFRMLWVEVPAIFGPMGGYQEFVKRWKRVK